MSANGHRIRISLRLKLLVLIGALLLGTMAGYLFLALRLITQDRLAYAFDLNQRVAAMLSIQVQDSLESTEERLRLFGELAVGRSDAEIERLARQLLASDVDLLRVSFFLREGPLMTARCRVVDEQRLVPLEISAAELDGLDRTRPLPLASLGSEPVVVLNRSLPPSALIISLVVGQRVGPGEQPAWVVALDAVPTRVLDAFAGGSTYVAYLVDASGTVLAHPDRAKMLGAVRLTDEPPVQAALAGGGITSGVLEHAAGDRRLLSAWARVGHGRLIAVASIDRAAALAAAERLVRLSALVGVAMVLAALLISIFAARAVTGPLRRLSAATAALAAGDYLVDPKVRSGDEIGELAQDFKRMARELRDAQVKLLQSEKLATFGQLGAGITHEIKNPLSAIRGFAQLALRGRDPAQVQESLEIIEKETQRCLEIVQNFLRFARQDKGERVRVEVNALVQDGLKIVAHQLAISGVKLTVELGDAPAVSVAANQIHQVMLNLLLNAAQATGRGGVIVVRTGVRDGRAEITVSDNGPGIPADVLPRIFEPFFTTKEAGKGTGLGLSVSYGIVRDHGGELVAESTPGAGATFRVLLPLAA